MIVCFVLIIITECTLICVRSVARSVPQNYIFLGVFNLNRVLTFDESEILSAYLEAGGDVYMEGADCWDYDPYSDVYMNPEPNLSPIAEYTHGAKNQLL